MSSRKGFQADHPSDFCYQDQLRGTLCTSKLDEGQLLYLNHAVGMVEKMKLSWAMEGFIISILADAMLEFRVLMLKIEFA